MHKLMLLLLLCILMGQPAFSQDKIQQAINSTKAAYNNKENDYITDGQRTVWVKSYTKWTPGDLELMKKEAPQVLQFLGQAIQHNRLDVLKQLLPDYYNTHGGVKAFAADIQRVGQ